MLILSMYCTLIPGGVFAQTAPSTLLHPRRELSGISGDASLPPNIDSYRPRIHGEQLGRRTEIPAVGVSCRKMLGNQFVVELKKNVDANPLRF
jgi:hypothetical protein